jgi:phage terminase large subunit GpA-like protein
MASLQLKTWKECAEEAGEHKPVITVTDWANQFRWFSHGQSWKSQHFDAPYDVDDAPFQRKPQDDLLDPDVQVHAWQMASRIAKTVMMGNGFGYFSHYDPTTQLFMYPSQDDADLRSREEFQPLIDVSPELRGKYQDVESNIHGQSTDSTISFKKFRGGSVAFVGSNAPSKLRARTARVIWCDECDGYRPSAGREGDPTTLAFNRAKNYPDPVKVVASTPTVRHHSVIEFWMALSDYMKWLVYCRRCNAEQFLTWHHYRWPGDDRSATQLYCEACDCSHDDDQRTKIIKEGFWKPTKPFKGIRGFFLPGYYTIFPAPKAFHGKMHEMAEDAHRAKHSQEPKQTVKVWVNTFLAESFLEESDAPPDWKDTLFNRREQYDREHLPKEVIVVTFGTDFQADRIEVVMWGHGHKDESWRIEKMVFNGDPRMPEMYDRLEAYLLQPFKRVDGAVLRAKAGGFDTGYYACMRQLYKWIRPRQRFNWYALKGASQLDADPVARAKKSRVSLVTLLMVGTHKIKSFIYNRANITNPGAGFMHFPTSMTENDFSQLFAEESRSIFKSGVEYKEFSLPSTGNKRNEELDCAVMAHAALYARGQINMDFEEKQNLKTIVEKNGEGATQPKRRIVRRQSNLIKSLKMGGM